MEIFFDNHRSSPIASFVKEAFPLFSPYWASPSSEHALGEKGKKEIPALLGPFFDLVQANTETPVFSGRKEEIVEKLALHIFLEKTLLEGKNHFFVASKIEHANLWNKLEERGCFVWEIPRDKEGLFDLVELGKKLSEKTALVMAFWAERFSGIIQPIEELSFLCEENKVDLYVDATFAVGKMFLLFEELAISFLHFEIWPIHGLSEESFLLTKKDNSLSELFSQKKWNIAKLAMASASCKQALLYLDAGTLKMGALRDLFEAEIEKRFVGAKKMFTGLLRLPNTSVIYFPKVSKELLSFYLNKKKLYVPERTPLLDEFCKKIKKEEEAFFMSAFSFSRYTTEEEILQGIQVLQETLQKMQIFTEQAEGLI